MGWPKMMFRHWHNMEVDEAGGGSVASESVWCPHCANTGAIDIDGVNLLRACPMCVLGGFRNKRWLAPMVMQGGRLQRAEVQHERLWSWASWDSPLGCSWSRGLTFAHTAVCVECRMELAVPGGRCSGCAVLVVAS